MYGFTTTYALFLVAMVIITIGEMLIAPGATIRRRQLVPGTHARWIHWPWPHSSAGISFAFGPMVAGNIMDNYDSRLLWLMCGLVGAMSVLLYSVLSTAQPTFSLNRWKSRLPARIPLARPKVAPETRNLQLETSP